MIAADGRWLSVPFLVDTGADRAVLSSETYRRLGFVGVDAARNLGGVGGLAETVRVTETRYANNRSCNSSRGKSKWSATSCRIADSVPIRNGSWSGMVM